MKRDQAEMAKVQKVQCAVLDCRGSALHRHHIVPRSLAQCDDALNLIVLCDEHHRRVHARTFDLGILLSPGQGAKAVYLLGTVHKAHKLLYPSEYREPLRAA